MMNSAPDSNVFINKDKWGSECATVLWVVIFQFVSYFQDLLVFRKVNKRIRLLLNHQHQSWKYATLSLQAKTKAPCIGFPPFVRQIKAELEAFESLPLDIGPYLTSVIVRNDLRDVIISSEDPAWSRLFSIAVDVNKIEVHFESLVSIFFWKQFNSSLFNSSVGHFANLTAFKFKGHCHSSLFQNFSENLRYIPNLTSLQLNSTKDFLWYSLSSQFVHIPNLKILELQSVNTRSHFDDDVAFFSQFSFLPKLEHFTYQFGWFGQGPETQSDFDSMLNYLPSSLRCFNISLHSKYHEAWYNYCCSNHSTLSLSEFRYFPDCTAISVETTKNILLSLPHLNYTRNEEKENTQQYDGLATLNLSNCCFDQGYDLMISIFSCMHNLTSLDLSNCKLFPILDAKNSKSNRDSCKIYSLLFGGMKKLTFLNLSNNKCSDAASLFEHFPNSKTNQSLKCLQLDWMYMGDVGALGLLRNLMQFEQTMCFESLSLRDSSISGKVLAEIQKLNLSSHVKFNFLSTAMDNCVHSYHSF